MKTSYTYVFLLVALVLVSIPGAYATGESPVISIVTEPTSLPSNTNYAVTYNYTDAETELINITYEFFVDDVSTRTITTTNVLANTTTAYEETITFNEADYLLGQSVYVNVTADDGNSTASILTTELTTTNCVGCVIEGDEINGITGLGSDLGNFLVNLAPGLFKIILQLSLAFAIVGVITAIILIARKYTDPKKPKI